MPISTINTTLLTTEAIQKESLYILIPLGSLLAVIIFSLLVYLMATNRCCINMYCKKRQRRLTLHEYNEDYSPLIQNNDAEEEEVDSEDNPAKSLLRGKLQINNHFENYLSTTQLSRSSELLT